MRSTLRRFPAAVLALMVSAFTHCQGDPLDEWYWRHPLPQGERITDIAFGNNRFVAVAKHMILTSSDGTNWTTHSQPVGTVLNGIGFGNGIFVAVGTSVMTSVNGTDWTASTTAITNFLSDVVFGNGTFVAVGPAGTILTSEDGATWIDRSGAVSTSLNLISAAFGNGLFVVCSTTVSVARSADGTSWTTTNGPVAYPQGLTFGNGTFLIAGASSGISTDGAAWTPVNEALSAAGFGQGQFVGYYNSIMKVSSDGSNWEWVTPYTGANYTTLYAFACGNGVHVAGGIAGLLRSSTDGTNWTTQSQCLTDYYLDYTHTATYAAGQFLIGGAEYHKLLSVSSMGLATYDTGNSDAVWDIEYIQNQFVVVSSFGLITSTNLTTWEYHSTGYSSQNDALTFGIGLYVLVGSNGSIRTSTNGLDWVEQTSGTSRNLFDVTYGGDRFVAVGGSATSPSPGDICWSTNGLTWTRLSSGNLRSVVYHGGCFVAVGLQGLARTSTNGVDWTTRVTGVTNDLCDVTWGHGMFLAVGLAGAIISSPDGITWSNRAGGTGQNLYAVAAGPESFIVGGDLSSVLESPGTTARLEAVEYSANAGFRLSVSGLLGARYLVQCSTNLNGWDELARITNDTPPTLFLDPGATSRLSRFYRTVVQ